MKQTSIYRGWRDRPWDNQVADVTARGAVSALVKSQEDITYPRHREPVGKLLPRTVDWLLALPPRARPHLLAAKYARIANQLCSNWSDAVACRAYFTDLLTDRRGGRKGFPVGIVRELRLLRRYHYLLHRAPDEGF